MGSVGKLLRPGAENTRPADRHCSRLPVRRSTSFEGNLAWRECTRISVLSIERTCLMIASKKRKNRPPIHNQRSKVITRLTLIILLIISGLQTATAGTDNFWIEKLDMETTEIANNDPLARTKLRKLVADKQLAGQLRVNQMIELKNEEIRRVVRGRLLQLIPRNCPAFT